MSPSLAESAKADRRRVAIPHVAAAAGLACALGAGVALWASEGARVFTDTAFAALIACF